MRERAKRWLDQDGEKEEKKNCYDRCLAGHFQRQTRIAPRPRNAILRVAHYDR
jgi:hypothetical protein